MGGVTWSGDAAGSIDMIGLLFDARAACDPIIADWMANGRRTTGPGSGVTITKLMLAWRGRWRPQYGSAERFRLGNVSQLESNHGPWLSLTLSAEGVN
jgi:hypothetical protein